MRSGRMAKAAARPMGLLSKKDASCAARSSAGSPAASAGMNSMWSTRPSSMRRISRRWASKRSCARPAVPPVRFSHQDFERQVRLGLDTAGLAPDRARRAIGAGFARDDSGCGFTSLACLQFYGFTCVKINRSLTKRVQPEQKAGHLISGLVQLAKGLDLRVVAEGVEGERLAKMLELAGCNELQGYHFGRPACPAQALNMAARPKQEITLA
ncbi:MAG: EAL domain-containing protein [Hyphomonas sp.]|nr:EAL domain-containing protein [Hyphomonas sp.]